MPVKPPADKPSHHLWFRFDALPADAVKDLATTGVIKGVSLIKVGPALGHTGWAEDGTPCQVMVDAETLNQTKLLAEGYANGLKSRSAHYTEVLDTVGYFNNFIIDGDALRADYNLFDTHSGYAHLVKLCQTLWDQFGLSIDFLGTLQFDTSARIAFARIEELFAADLTPEPAANAQGLYARGSNSARAENPQVGAITFDKIEKPKPQGTKIKYMKSVAVILAAFATATSAKLAFRAPGRRFDEAAPQVELAAEATLTDLAADMAELILTVGTINDKVKAMADAEAAKVAASATAAAAAAAAGGAATPPAAPVVAGAITNPTALSEVQALQTEFTAKVKAVEAKYNIALTAAAGAPAAKGLQAGDDTTPAAGSPEAIKAEYAALKDPAKKLAFRKKHRDVLFS